MINALAISLILSSLFAAQVLSPNPALKHQNTDKNPDVIVKEGRRVIVVESYDQNGLHNTKVSISPPLDPIDTPDGKFPSGFFHDGAEDKMKRGISSGDKYGGGGGGGGGEGQRGPSELICDAIEKHSSKHKMSEVLHKAKDQALETADVLHKVKDKAAQAAKAGWNIKKEAAYEAKDIVEDAYGRTMDKVSEKAHGAKEVIEDAYGAATKTASEKARGAKEAVEDAYGTARDKVSEKAHGAIEKVEDAYEKASEKSHGAKEAVGDVYGKLKETASEKAHGAKETVEDTYGKVKEAASEKAHGAKEMVEDVYGEVKEADHGAKEKVEDALGKARDTAEKVGDAYEKTKDYAVHKAHDWKETATNIKQAKDIVKTTKDTGKTIRIDTATNITEQVGHLRNVTGRAGRFIFGGLKNGLGYMVSGEWLDLLMGMINLLGFSIAYGMGMWVTFISSHVLASSLPRQQFGIVQSRIYPVYFRAMGVSIAMALVGHIGGHRSKVFSGGKSELRQICNLIASLVAVSVNVFYLEPLSTKVMFEKFRLEKEEGRGGEIQAPVVTAALTPARTEAEEEEQREIRERMTRMDKRLKMLNSYSAFLNILVLMGLSWHLVDVAHRVHQTC